MQDAMDQHTQTNRKMKRQKNMERLLIVEEEKIYIICTEVTLIRTPSDIGRLASSQSNL